jgi:O-antigen ligase/tetratricopeptide (TPR) repeat protein
MGLSDDGQPHRFSRVSRVVRSTPPVWLLLPVLFLLPPLVQGATPRLPGAAIALSILAFLVAAVLRLARGTRHEVQLTVLDALLGCFLFWALFSMLFAPYYHAAEQALLPLLCSALLYWLLVFQPSFAGLETAVLAVRLQALGQALLVFWQHFGAGAARPEGTFYNPNFLAGFLSAAIVLTLGAVVFPPPGTGRTRPALHASRAVECALLAGAILLTGSRGGMLSLVVGLAVLLGLRAWRLALAVGVAGTAALLVIPNPWLDRLRTLPGGDVFAYTRLSIWKSAAAMMLDHPWIGVGLGQFEYNSPRYAFPLVKHWAKTTRVAENAHCEYLQVGAEMGVVGLLLFLGAAVFLAVVTVRRLRSLPPGERGAAVTFLAALAAVLSHAAVDFTLHTPPASLLLVLLAAGLRIHGVTGPVRDVEYRFRPAHAALVVVIACALAYAAVRPVVGFVSFLRGIGAPVDLLREKWALEKAPHRKLPTGEALRHMERAARVDFFCAPYHRALGSLLFQSYLRGEAGEETLRKALFQLSFATELNPLEFQYHANFGQAMTALAQLQPPGVERLREALRHYERAAELAPRQSRLFQELGRLHDLLHDRPRAEQSFRHAVELEEYNLPAWRDLGTFYARNGMIDQARAAFTRGAALAEKARTLVPTSPGEEELIALQPADFYNALSRLPAGGRSGS